MKLIFEDLAEEKAGPGFIQKVKDVTGRLGYDPDYLMASMYVETAKKFSPTIFDGFTQKWMRKHDKPGFEAPNPHMGLIQFSRETARRLGTSLESLAEMSAVQQLDYVEKYYNLWARATNVRPKTLEEVYITIHGPARIGKPKKYSASDREALEWVKAAYKKGVEERGTVSANKPLIRKHRVAEGLLIALGAWLLTSMLSKKKGLA